MKLAKLGINDVKLKIMGHVEDTKYSLFKNEYLKERFYNRIVVIDVIPKK